MKLFMLLMLCSCSLWAQDQIECVPIGKVLPNELIDLKKHLEWHGATTEQIEKAACKTLTPPSLNDLERILQDNGQKATSAQINGVSFSDENPVLIEAFKSLTTLEDFFETKPKEDQKDFQALHKINPECQKVRCAMEKIWGKNLSEKILYLKLKHNFNASEYAFENSDRFTEAELDDVLMGLEDLPPHLIPMGKENQRLSRFKHGYTLKAYGPEVIANAMIMLFDPWDEQTHPQKQYTIFHEVSHNTSSKLDNMDESPEWLALSSWVKTGDKWTADTNACQISKYGATNAWEDFAEAMSAYRYNAQDFKDRCPKKYAFMKEKVYHGIEYTESKLCTPIPASNLAKMQKDVLGKIKNSLKPEQFTTAAVEKTCVNSFSYPVKIEERLQCSSRLMVESQFHTTEVVSQTLLEAKIPNTLANRNQVLDGLNPMIQKDIELQKKMGELATGIPEAIDELVKQSIKGAIPQGMSKNEKPLTVDDYAWKMGQEKCRELVLNSVSQDELTHCHLKTIIERDKSSQHWDNGFFSPYRAPSIFKKETVKNLEKQRDDALEAHLFNQETTKQAMIKMKADILDRLSWQQSYVASKLYSMDDWKKLSPEDFCAQTYAHNNSGYYTAFGIKEGAQVPTIQAWCVAKQSEKKRRYEFSREDWNAYTESLFK